MIRSLCTDLAVLGGVALLAACASDPPVRVRVARAEVPDVLATPPVEDRGALVEVPPGFTVVEVEPFRVLGDEPTLVVTRQRAPVVRWAARALEEAYFETRPEPFDVWLFKDDASYRHHAKALFGDEPETPYGYASDEHKALIMNIGTGAGTLVHELVHPYIHADFPGCPPWFNEGLASLYEYFGRREDGSIRGFVNWRLRDLQPVVRERMLPDFEELLALDAAGFYGPSQGTNYAQARYLVYWLQEHGVLRRYYRELKANHDADPTGVATLRAVLGEDDLDAFQQRWEAWVLELEIR